MNRLTLTVLVIIFVQGIYTAQCAMSHNFENKAGDPPRPMYYNLTDLINMVLKENCSDNYNQLQNAIIISPHVLYETDVLLDNIQEIVPVLNLFQQFKTKTHLNPQIMLTFRCVNSSGYFLESRIISDVFYSLDKELSAEFCSQMLNFVSAIALDFGTLIDLFPVSVGDYLRGFSVTKSVRDFFHFQCGRADISIGVIYSPVGYNRPESNFFLANQTMFANFTIFPIWLDFKYEFPMSYTQFDSSLRKKRTYPEDAMMLLVIRKSDLPNLTTYLHNYHHSWCHYVISHGSLFYYIEKALNDTSCSNTTCVAREDRLYSVSLQVFKKLIQTFATLERKDVVIGNPWQNFTQENEWRISDIDRDVLTQPLINFPDVDVDVCKLRETLNTLRVRFTTMGTDEKTWRNILRREQQLFGDNNRCISSKEFFNPQSNFPMNVSLYFTNGISTVWQMVEPFMEKVIKQNLHTGDLSLQTLVFLDTDIEASEQLQNFILKAKKQYAIGCSVSFKKMLSYFNDNPSINPPSDFFTTKLESNLCSPIFQAVDICVWRIDNDYQTGGLFKMYYGVSMIKEIFVQEFPGKQVVVEYQSDKRLVAEIYNLTVSFPWSQSSEY